MIRNLKKKILEYLKSWNMDMALYPEIMRDLDAIEYTFDTPKRGYRVYGKGKRYGYIALRINGNVVIEGNEFYDDNTKICMLLEWWHTRKKEQQDEQQIVALY